MSHKTFISYKYSEARRLRDDIIDAFGEDATYYKGETSDSPNITNTTTDNIKRYLKDMIYDTSVTIVIISPNMKQSKWIDWEIEYSLKSITRSDRTSHPNGIVGVIMKYNGGYDWFKRTVVNNDGCHAIEYQSQYVYDIINENRFNQDPKVYACETCKTVNEMTGCYISYVEEETFLNNPDKYIDNAFDKSQNDAECYDLVKTR